MIQQINNPFCWIHLIISYLTPRRQLFRLLFIWMFPKIMVPPNHPFVHRVFHYFHHPFWVVFPLFLETPIFEINWNHASDMQRTTISNGLFVGKSSILAMFTSPFSWDGQKKTSPFKRGFKWGHLFFWPLTLFFWPLCPVFLTPCALFFWRLVTLFFWPLALFFLTPGNPVFLTPGPVFLTPDLFFWPLTLFFWPLLSRTLKSIRPPKGGIVAPFAGTYSALRGYIAPFLVHSALCGYITGT